MLATTWDLNSYLNNNYAYCLGALKDDIQSWALVLFLDSFCMIKDAIFSIFPKVTLAGYFNSPGHFWALVVVLKTTFKKK